MKTSICGLMIFGVVSSLVGCGAKSKHSKLNEAPDYFNIRERFGMTKPMTWDDVSTSREVSLNTLPWTDTYWPLAAKETAARWQGFGVESNSEVGFSAYLKT